MADNVLSNVLGEDYQEVNAVNSGNAVYKNGKLQYFKIDVDQPGKYFFNLTDAFNASVDEANKIIPIQFVRGGGYLPLNGFNVSMDGTYPNGTTEFHIAGETQGANPAFINFNMPLGMFQAVGTYRFQFTITNTSTGEVLKSPFQFFDVSQTATNLAVDMSNGIEPYDSEYTKWKNKVEQEINTLMDTLNNIKVASNQMQDLMNQYIQNVEAYAQSAWQKMLQQDNSWGGTQQFNKAQIKDFQADRVSANNLIGDNLDISGNALLESAPALKYVGGDLKRGLFAYEEYFNIDINPSNNNGGAVFVNGVQSGAGGMGYMTIRTFRITNADDKTSNIIVEMRANCNIPDSAVGKTIVQFPTSCHMFEGIDQTPFYLGNWVLQFSAADKTLRCQGKINSSGTNNLQDSKML